MRNQFRKPKKCELRLFLFFQNKLTLKRKYTNEVSGFTLQRSMNSDAICHTNSRPTYRQILGYNNPILRQTPLTGGSLPAVVFLDLDYSICRLCL